MGERAEIVRDEKLAEKGTGNTEESRPDSRDDGEPAAEPAKELYA